MGFEKVDNTTHKNCPEYDEIVLFAAGIVVFDMYCTRLLYIKKEI